jgi:Tfp pilus assembly protein PilF
MSDTLPGAAQVQRGLLLMQQRRYVDAADFFRQALAQNPRDAFAFNRLAVCQLQLPAERPEALQTIERALECEPNDALNHAVKAFILCTFHRFREGLAAAREAIALDPDSVFALNAEGNALAGLERWAEVEQTARRALALDADASTAANQLAHALRLQNKMAENAGQIAGMLARDPEDATTHCSAGWAALQRGERQAAERHFLEALRLNPGMEAARQGLLNSFRARSPVYRLYLAYCFRMSRLPAGARWGVVLGLYLGVKFARILFTGRMAPVGITLGVLYLVFALWVWVAKGLGSFILLFDRFARHALRSEEKVEAIFVGGGICAAIVLVLASLPMDNPSLLILGIACGCSTIPFSLTFTNGSKIGSRLFGVLGSLTLLGGLAGAAASLLPEASQREMAITLFAGGLICAAITTWLGNIPALRR